LGSLLRMNREAGIVFFIGLLTATVASLASCSSDDESTPDAGASSSGGTSSGFQSSGDLPDANSPPCVAKEAEAIEGSRPIDIIFLIDNSDSMAEEIGEVEKQINQNFAGIIEASNTDYRVIMLSNHGAHDGTGLLQRVCVSAPLSGSSCTPIPQKPVESARFFHHNIIVNSTDAFCRILQTFNAPDLDGSHPQGWSTLLRPNAFKVFAIISDDRVDASCNGLVFDDKTVDPVSGTTAASSFESALYALSPQFGNLNRRNYVWHSIVGVAPFDANDLTKPHPSDAPIVAEKCVPSSIAPGIGHQALSKLSGGLRYPTCGLNYTTIFQAMAKDVISKKLLACDYALPTSTEGAIDPATAVVRYTASNGVVTDFEQAPNAGACGANKFYIEEGRIRLCPDSCLTVQNDVDAKVKILFGCKPKEQK
jgi:hypothetical protein